MNITCKSKPYDKERQRKYNLKTAWKRRMHVFLGLCRNCGGETSRYLCAACRRKKMGKRICKIPFCQNILPKGKQFCDEHSSYRSYYHNPSCSVNFNFCKYCGQLFTAKKSNCKTCNSCADNNMQAKEWAAENKEKVRESQRKSYNKIKDDPDFKKKLKKYRIKNKPKSDKYFKEYNKTEKRAAAIKESAEKRSLVPGVKEKTIKANMYSRLFLCDNYIKEKISRRLKVKKDNITPEMIVIDRELMEHQRLIKELNNVINRRLYQRIERVA